MNYGSTKGHGWGKFSYEIMKNDGLVVLKTTGRPEIEDYQDAAPKIFSDAKSQNIRRILMDWRDHGPFFSWLEGRSLFDRIAIVFHEGVRNEVDKFEELFRNASKEVRRFRADRYEVALDWLKA